MKPQDLAAIYNGMSFPDKVEFLAAINLKNDAFLMADEITYNASSNKQEQDVLEAIHGINSLLLEYHLNFGTNRLAEGKYKNEPVEIIVNDKDEINGIFVGGFFFSDDSERFEEIEWKKVEVCHG